MVIQVILVELAGPERSQKGLARWPGSHYSTEKCLERGLKNGGIGLHAHVSLGPFEKKETALPCVL